MNETVKEVWIVHQTVLTAFPLEYVTERGKCAYKLVNADLVCYNVIQYPSSFLVPEVFLYTSGLLCSYMCLDTECTIPTSSFVLWEIFVLVPVMFHVASLACLGFGRTILGDSLMLLYCIGGFLGKRHGHAAYIWMGS